MIEIAAGLTGLRAASELVTRLREALAEREVKPDEVLARLIEMQGLISDGRTALIDSQEDLLDKNKSVAQLEAQIAKLEGLLNKKQQGVYHDNAAWRILDNGKEEGPFCPNCFETTGNFIQPYRMATNNGLAAFSCGEHKTQYTFRIPVQLVGELETDKPRPTPRLRSDYPI